MNVNVLTHWDINNMANIWQITISNAFFQNKISLDILGNSPFDNKYISHLNRQ